MSSFLAQAIRLAPPLLFLVIGAFSYVQLSQEPAETKRPPAPPRVIKTAVADIPLQDYQITVMTRGIVRPHNEVTLTADVAGKVTEIAPPFEDGAFFSKDDILIELDDADYKTSVLAAEAQLARAKATSAQEQARAKQALLNWNDLGYSDEPNELVLRLPQLRETEASVKSASAQLERAQRDLERTRVRAPFNGRVHQRTVGIGQSVGNGTSLGTIFATDFAEVRLPISAHELDQLSLPEEGTDPPVQVNLRNAVDESSPHTWTAEIVRTEGTLDEQSLELFAIARISDPFGRVSGKRPLRIGQPVTGAIKGHVLEQVYVIPRRAVRQVDRIFLVMKEEMKLDRRIITPIWSDLDHFIIRDPGMFEKAYLATSSLSYTPHDAKVEILSQEKVAEESDVPKETPKKTQT